MNNTLKQFYRIGRYWLRERMRFFPAYPNTINFDITYLCNSHCAMCNIWKHGKAVEFSTEELQIALSRTLFKRVEHVGLTGGEPSLRRDFPSIVDVLIKYLPRLKSLSIITNCVSPTRSESIISCLYEKCREAGIQFGLVLSMDGVGSFHDNNRGVKGNYASLMRVVDYVSEKQIPFSLGCTITKKNLLSIYDTFDLARSNGWSIYFAVAEYIDRLNNQDCDAIQSFSEDERYELLLFFHKLMNDPRIPSLYRRSYWKDFELLSGRSRPIGCPYHREGIVLSPELDVGHCAVKGRRVGNASREDITSLFFKSWFANKEHVKGYCGQCFHYHYQKSSKEEIEALKARLMRRFISQKNLKSCCLYAGFSSRPALERYVLIVGWYGTETVGDKAILATVMKDFADQGYQLVIASIYPFVTERTLKELGVDALIIKSESTDLIKYSRYAEKVVMGGGPLMDLYDIKYPLIAFSVSHRFKHENIIYGCGIGPVKSDYYGEEIREILALADRISLRDSISVQCCTEWFPEKEVELVEDPAVEYIVKQSDVIQAEKKGDTLACFLRKMPKEFSTGEDDKMEEWVASYVLSLAKQNGLTRIVLHSMHNFWVGNDDREFARYFKEKYLSDSDDGISVVVDNSLSTVDNTIEKVKAAGMVLCMRFHSMLFAHYLGSNYKVIDYTNGGKIMAFLKDHDSMDRLVKIPFMG